MPLKWPLFPPPPASMRPNPMRIFLTADFPDVPSLKHSLHLASMISFSLICGLILFIAPWQLIIFY